MVLTVTDAALGQVLVSHALLAQTWPNGFAEAMTLIQALRCAVPSLAVVLAVGLVEVVAPDPGDASSLISLRHRSAVLVGMAGGQDGAPIAEPHLRPEAVRRLAITDVSVDGRSGLRLAV